MIRRKNRSIAGAHRNRFISTGKRKASSNVSHSDFWFRCYPINLEERSSHSRQQYSRALREWLTEAALRAPLSLETSIANTYFARWVHIYAESDFVSQRMLNPVANASRSNRVAANRKWLINRNENRVFLRAREIRLLLRIFFFSFFLCDFFEMRRTGEMRLIVLRSIMII
jgi:hypothetical protein